MAESFNKHWWRKLEVNNLYRQAPNKVEGLNSREGYNTSRKGSDRRGVYNREEWSAMAALDLRYMAMSGDCGEGFGDE